MGTQQVISFPQKMNRRSGSTVAGSIRKAKRKNRDVLRTSNLENYENKKRKKSSVSDRSLIGDEMELIDYLEREK